ncbi:MAG TPA: NAD(P)-dependent oxidoreductase [Kofleriaceae bacterium]|nr:NAD(P)-dependent oxidoreductase [Kofleriaceae bacterium]
MKVLVADKFERVGIDGLAALGCTVVDQPTAGSSGLPAALQQHDPDVLIVRSSKVTAEAVAAAGRLTLIIRAGAGVDTIDVGAASRAGIFVANCPGKNAVAVAELAWALILACDRRVPAQTEALRRGEWNKKEFSQARGLRGGTLGVLGLGTIGAEVAARGLAFGMEVVAWSRSLTDERAAALGVRRADGPLAVARAADVISIHVAGGGDTADLVDAAFVDAMKPGAILVNTSRGSVIDEAALLRGVRDKGIRAGVDVFKGEPAGGTGQVQSPLFAEPGVIGTHHVGASTEQAQRAIADEVVRIVGDYRASGQVRNCVNRARRSHATCLLTVRHRNRPGVLAKVFDVLSEASINVEEMENLIYEGAEAACARIQLAQPPSEAHVNEILARCADILSLDLAPLLPKGDRP